MELIPVSHSGSYMEVHPTTLMQHKKLGWLECEKQVTQPLKVPYDDLHENTNEASQASKENANETRQEVLKKRGRPFKQIEEKL